MSQLKVHKLEEQRRLLMERQDRLKVASPIAGKVITSEVEVRLLRRPVTTGHALITIQPPLVWNAALPLTVLTGVGFGLNCGVHLASTKVVESQRSAELIEALIRRGDRAESPIAVLNCVNLVNLNVVSTWPPSQRR